MRRLISTALAASVLAFSGAAPRAQSKPAPSQTPTFRSSTALVEVDIIVKDKDGRFVSGLTSDDFEVFEEGQPQTIQHFYLVTQTPTASTEPRSDVVLPRSPDQMERRAFVLFFDTEHLASSGLARLKDAAMNFIRDHFRRNDLAGVFANGTMWRGRLSSDMQDVLDGIRWVTPAFETSARRLAMLVEYPRIESEFDALRIDSGDQRLLEDIGTKNCIDEPQSCAQEGGREYVIDKIQRKARMFVAEARRAASSTLDVLTYMSRNLARLEGRKTLVMLSEGFLVDEIRSQLPQIAGEASRAGVTIYTINARGTAGTGGRIVADASVNAGSLSTYGDSSEEGLDILSVETGGIAFRHSDNFAAALTAVASDTSTYYVLAYSPQNATLDGKFRRIQLKTKWGGLTVRARRGYVASPLPAPKPIRTGR